MKVHPRIVPVDFNYSKFVCRIRDDDVPDPLVRQQPADVGLDRVTGESRVRCDNW